MGMTAQCLKFQTNVGAGDNRHRLMANLKKLVLKRLGRCAPKVVSHSLNYPDDLNFFSLLCPFFYCGKIHIT